MEIIAGTLGPRKGEQVLLLNQDRNQMPARDLFAPLVINIISESAGRRPELVFSVDS